MTRTILEKKHQLIGIMFYFWSFFGLMPVQQYLLPRLRVVSSVQQLSVPPQHVCSCSLSDLASHFFKVLSAWVSLFSLFSFFSWSGLFFVVFSYEVR